MSINCNFWAARVSSSCDLLQMQLSHVIQIITAWSCQLRKYGFKEFALYSIFFQNKPLCDQWRDYTSGVSENKSHSKSSIKWKDLNSMCRDRLLFLRRHQALDTQLPWQLATMKPKKANHFDMIFFKSLATIILVFTFQ